MGIICPAEREMVRVGEYQFNYSDTLGNGGYGDVYEGNEIQDPVHKVAIKIIKTNLISTYPHNSDIKEKEEQ